MCGGLADVEVQGEILMRQHDPVVIDTAWSLKRFFSISCVDDIREPVRG